MPSPRRRVKNSSRRIALVTGAAGFAGSHLVEHLLAHEYEVIATVGPKDSLTNLVGVEKKVTIQPVDITDQKKLKELVDDHGPRWIFHLAAMASVGASFSDERGVYEVNFLGTLNVLEAARGNNVLEKIVVVSSADAYGAFRPRDKKLTESQPLNPISPYGVSKAAVEHLSQYHVRQFGLPIVIARPFNHTGPRQDDRFVIPSFCRQIALIESGKQGPIIRVGDLSAKRDLGDVRDVVAGYEALASRGVPGQAYHLSTGRAVTIKEALRQLLRLSSAKIAIEIDASRLRKVDIPVLLGANRKASKELGWSPRYSLKETLVETLTWWRQRVGQFRS